MERGVHMCGSGVGVRFVATKVSRVRACLIHESFWAPSIEDDALNMICLGGLVVGHALAWEFVRTFLGRAIQRHKRHRRRLAKVAVLETRSMSQPTRVSQPDLRR